MPKTTGADDATLDDKMDDVVTQLKSLQKEAKKPGIAAAGAGFDWAQLIPIILSLIEAWKNRK